MTLTTRKTLQFLVDNICADFTVDKLLGTARACLANGPCPMADIAGAIRRKDPSLDQRCADGLAAGVADALVDFGEAEVENGVVYPPASGREAGGIQRGR
jgi:hypothetical protein